MLTKERQSYDREFKQKAVELSFLQEATPEKLPKSQGSAQSCYTGGAESPRNTRIIVYPAKGSPK